MRYRTLGRTGIKVSPYALGAMMFGAVGNPDHDDSIKIIHRAMDAGINFVDTADTYSHGELEQIVGPRTIEHLDDLLAGVDVTLTDEILDRIDEIVPPGTDIGRLDMAYDPPAIEQARLRRRPVIERAAA